MIKWDYQIIIEPLAQIHAHMVAAGAQGYEAISFVIVDSSQRCIAVLKRPIEEAREPVAAADPVRRVPKSSHRAPPKRVSN